MAQPQATSNDVKQNMPKQPPVISTIMDGVNDQYDGKNGREKAKEIITNLSHWADGHGSATTLESVAKFAINQLEYDRKEEEKKAKEAEDTQNDEKKKVDADRQKAVAEEKR